VSLQAFYANRSDVTRSEKQNAWAADATSRLMFSMSKQNSTWRDAKSNKCNNVSMGKYATQVGQH